MSALKTFIQQRRLCRKMQRTRTRVKWLIHCSY